MMIKSLKKTAKANLGDLTSQIIDLELKGEGDTPQCKLLWDKARCLTWLIRQRTLELPVDNTGTLEDSTERSALDVWRNAAMRDTMAPKYQLGSLGELI